jgi:N utilization substance protein B
VGQRRKGREQALQLAYGLDLGGLTIPGLPAAVESLPAASARTREFATRLVEGAWADLAAIDRTIEGQAEHWHLSRMTPVDRNILRLAVHELEHFPDIPPKATVNEWIEIAKKYGTEHSASFVNGILDPILRRRPDPSPEGEGETPPEP